MSKPLDIAKTILSDPINKWIFSIVNTDIFLVGGYVRDILRGIISKDKDYTLKNNIEDIANQTAKKFNGTLIPLKPQTTYRVVLRNKDVLDFSYLQGSIDEDLKKRDFTINAIAWMPRTGIIDPFGGRVDLNNKIIKAVRMKNLLSDPLRIIRAYRFAAELGFKIEQDTKENLKRYSRVLPVVASERITEELFKILKNKNATKCLDECYKDGVLGKIFAIGADRLSSNIKLLSKLDLFLKAVHRKLKNLLKEELSQGLNRTGVMRLALLLMDTPGTTLGKTRLRVSRNIKNALSGIEHGHTTAIRYEAPRGKISREKLFKIFKGAGDSIFEISMLLSITEGYNIKTLLNNAEKFLKVKNNILLNGDDIQKILNISAGNKIGTILSAIQEAQFKGYVKTKAEAKRWLLNNFT